MADQHARTPSAESYESGSGPSSSQASTLPGHTYPSQHTGGRSAYDEYGHDDLDSRQPSFINKKGGDNVGTLARLVEALEDYEGGDGDAYSDISADQSLLSGGHKRRPSSALLDSEFPMPHKPRKGVPFFDEEEEEESYCAAPFNMNAPDVEAPLPSSYGEGGDDNTPLPTKFRRGRKFSLYGCLVTFIYLCAFGFYLFVRCAKTLDLGDYVWYGVIVLVVEVAGATTTLVWCMNIIMDPVHEPLRMDPENPGLTLVARPYHIRVLIPCYNESLEIVGKTAMAALDAMLPASCDRTVYICDDGKDAAKRKWARQMGTDLVYVSGRKRKPGEMNGKSCNLNNCLSQIYPEGVPIPPHELVCIFDADQVANVDFFVKMIPLFDAGDDVGMVLSPQCFHNVNVGADIFNHCNINFWEYAQHGYDAFGFISCTGTNFLTRSAAFEQAGWSPEYTLTEDYALGMELTKRKWYCRYVEEYLAIGEAPEQVRNCFQQRSRWCKGHFQIVLNNEHSPLFQKDLSWFQRLMYCSGVWAYIVGAITTPMFIVIPLVTVWAGVFPIVVSWWAAVALTAFIIAQTLVTSYCRNRKHFKPLWFNSVSNNILWFTFVKGCWRAVGSSFGKSITFKTTLKGSNMLMKNGLGDLWMPCVCFLGLLASLGFGLHKVITQQQGIITTLTLSLVWIVYSIIPQYLLLHYTWVGRGTTLRYACQIGFWVSSLCALCAIILLWLVYPKTYDYSKMLDYSHQFYRSQWVGDLDGHNGIPTWRASPYAFTTEVGPTRLNWGDITGGVMEGGDAGTVKITPTIAWTTSMLAWSMLSFGGGYNKSTDLWAKGKETLQWNTDYLLKTIKDDPVSSALSKKPEFFIVYQVGNQTQEKAVWTRPEDDTGPRPAYYVTTYNGTSDLAGQLSAAFSATAMVFQSTDQAYYERLMNVSTLLYDAGTRRRGSYTRGHIYPCATNLASTSVVQTAVPECLPGDEFFKGAMLATFNSTSWADDLTWAAAWLNVATGDPAYLSDAYRWYNQHYVSTETVSDKQYISDWNQLIYPASLLLANITDDNTFHYSVQLYLRNWLCTSGDTIEYTGLGRAFNRNDPSLAQGMNSAFMALLYAQLIEPSAANIEAGTLVNEGYAKRYKCWAQSQARYILGDVTRSFYVGFGKNPPTHLSDRASSCPGRDVQCSFLNAYYTPNANPNIPTGALVYGAGLNGDYFVDQRSGSNVTWVSHTYNAGLTGVFAGLSQMASGNTGYDQCLQGYGVLSKTISLCKTTS
ncbi:hypothetical protein ABBQ32_000684 [Trebouxia sp. C0010 RCD-2024]